jgi:hypothetical protein
LIRFGLDQITNRERALKKILTMKIPISLYFLYLAYWTLVGLQLGHFADDPGLGWHLLTGEWIISQGGVPHTDPFLASTIPRAWIADQWLSDLLMAVLGQIGGNERGIVLLYGVWTGIFILVFMGVTYWGAVNRSGSPLLAGIAAFLALKLSSIHFILRPVVIGFIFFSVVTWFVWRLVERVRAGRDVRIRDVAALVPLTALWANMHPSFALGIIVVGLATFGLLYETVVIDQRPIAGRSFSLLGATLALMTCATLLNPYGADLLKQVFGLVSDEFFMNLNEEWRPINLRTPAGQLFLQTGVVLLLGAFLAPRRAAPIYLTEPLIVGFFAWSALSSVRFLPYYAIVAAPLLAQSFCRILAFEPFMRLPPYRRIGALLVAINKREHRAMPAYICLLLGFACFPVVNAKLYGTLYPYRGSFGPSRDVYPYDGVNAIGEIIARESLPQPVAVAATPDWGGFLALQGKGIFKPVIDDRNSLLGVSAYKDFFESAKIGGDISNYLNRVNARFLLLKTNEPLAVYLRDTGKLPERWRGEVSALFEARP